MADDAALGCLETFRPLLRKWNATSAEIVAGYLDDSVTAEAFLRTSDRVQPELEAVVAEMQAARDECDQLSHVLDPLVATYNDKISGYNALAVGVRIGSDQAQQDALDRLMDANDESTDLACEFLAEIAEQRPDDKARQLNDASPELCAVASGT